LFAFAAAGSQAAGVATRAVPLVDSGRGAEEPRRPGRCFPATARAADFPPARARTFLAGLALLIPLLPGWGASDSWDWQAEKGCRWVALAIPDAGKTGFTLLPPEATGVRFTNQLADASSALNRILENGSGVALGDVDGDGWCDIYLCRLEGDNALYRNLGGWRFEDITAAAGVACPDQYSTGAVFADLDGDGDLDLLVNSIGGGTRAFRNAGRGQFTEITDTRLVHRFGSTSLALADIDGDGDLDLYVTNYRTTTYKDRPPGLKVEARMVEGRIVVTPEDRFIPLMPHAGGVEVLERGERDFLYVNDGTGRFAPVSWTHAFLDENGAPLKAAPTDWGLAVMFRDFNGDGTPDLYVCNDFFYSPDRVWLNEQSRRFRAWPRLAQRHMCVSSMGLDVADINRDGLDDFFVADMVSRNHSWRQRQRPNLMQGIVNQPFEQTDARPEVPHNTLFLNRGDGTYAEIAQLAGVDFTEWSWGAVFLDVDLDGYEDLLVPTGNNHDVQDADVLRSNSQAPAPQTLEERLASWRRFPALATPMLAFRNNGDLTFSEQTGAWGFAATGPWQGLALADLDRDGDLDLVVNRLNGAVGLYRNESPAPRLAVRLRGTPPNTRGISARIKVCGGPVTQSQEMICGGRYLSGDDNLRVFAAFTASNRFRVEVTWRSGRRSVVENAAANRLYEIAEAGADAAPEVSPPPVPPLFADVSASLNHTNLTQPVDDFARQPLLSRKLSTLGPGLGWFDVDGDGHDELILGAGRGSGALVFRYRKPNGFTLLSDAPSTLAALRDATTILAYSTRTGLVAWVAGESGFGADNAPRPAVRCLAPAAREFATLTAGYEAMPGPLAIADLDGDGELDLFVGGRCQPERYPAPVSSHVFRGDQGAFRRPDPANDRRLEKLGLVSGAVFSDLDGDGLPELVLACEWGPIRVFRNRRGELSDWDAPVKFGTTAGHTNALSAAPGRETTLHQLTGWWNSVATGDFDGDGRLDIVAANWGRNTRFQRYLASPLRVYYGDLAGSGSMELVESYYEPALKKWVPWRTFESVTKAFPFLTETVPTYRAYGEASLDEMFGNRLKSANLSEAATLDSLVLLNRGDYFEARPLPVEAQFAPVFGIAVADFDGDGGEDVFLSQNFFGVEPETSRYDAGVGLWLRGDGHGDFRAMSANESGVHVHGQGRACAVSDYDEDGRTDLVVAQHGEATRLFRNTGGKPGLRVRVKGPSGNPLGIGAVLRGITGARLGPAREIHAGAGYWAQDSAVPVITADAPLTALWIRWPGGAVRTLAVPLGARELEVSWGSLDIQRVDAPGEH
jgi:hypothetical protein